MTISLTEGAIGKICERELVGESEVKPVVQVMDVKLVKTPNNQNQNQSERQRYRMVLSDGTHMQQGMLATQHNHLVDSGRLQKGSIIRMNHFVCSPVKDRLIIVVVELEVVLDKHDFIGEPVMAKVPGVEATRPSGIASSPLNASAASHPVNLESRNYPTTNAAPTYSSTEGAPRPVQSSGWYGGQNMGFRNNVGELPLTPVNSYAHQPQPTYQQPQPTYQQSHPAAYQQPRPVYQQPQPAFQPPRPAYQQPPPNYMNRGPIARNEAAARIIPIAALNPYQNRWTIKARVTSKGEVRHYNNAKGDGKVFSFDLLDSDGGEIRVTCFNAAADQFYNQIEPGRIYLISRGTLRPAQRNFNHLRNDHEILLEATSIVQPSFEEDALIPRQQFHFLPISDVEGMENNSIVDVIGVVTSISPAASIMRKNGTETQKRTLQLKDESGRSVEVTLWGNFCHAEGERLQALCDSGRFPVLAVKSARVSEFNGKAVGTISSSQLFVEPDIQEACRLKEWFDREGKNAPSVSISREMSTVGRTDVRKTVSQIKDEKLGTSEKPDWITVSATVAYMKVDNFCYTACPLMIGDRQCNKKVTNNGDGKWRCDRCDRCIDECDYRYIIQLQIQDHTGLTWVTAFQESGEEIMGLPAKELFHLKTEQEDDRFAEVIRRVLFSKYIFKLKVKEEIFSDEQRVKSTVVKAEKINFSSESKFLLDLLDKSKAEVPAVKMENGAFGSGITDAVAGNSGSGQPYSMGSNYATGSNVGGSFGSPVKQSVQFNSPYGTSSRISGTSPYNTHINCNSCGSSGHNSANCPSLMQSQPQASGGTEMYAGRASHGSGTGGGSSTDVCYKCHQSGHWARDCPGLSSIPPAYGSGAAAPHGRYGMVPKERVGGF